MSRIRIGVVNWDASLTGDTYFGHYQIRSLSQAKYRTWVPFYADIKDAGNIDYHERTPEEYEAEMRYAIDAGIDYFAYVWYPDEGSRRHEPTSPNDCSHKVYELNYARRLYERTALKDRLNMCAILAAHPFADSDVYGVADALGKPYYEKIGGRPLVYVYGGYREDLIKRVLSACRERGVPDPYFVPMLSGAPKGPMPLADAVSAYAVSASSDVSGYPEMVRIAAENDVIRMRAGKDIIPLFTAGWNPSPRNDRPTPWMSDAQGKSRYPDVRYAPPPDAAEITAGAETFARHIDRDVGDKFAGHVLTFAWNEFEEGGFICPTYTKEGDICDSRLRGFAQAARIFRSLPFVR